MKRETRETPHGEATDGGPEARSRVRVTLVEELANTLGAMAVHEPEVVTKQEAVRRLLPSIRGAQEKGYSVRRIAALLSEGGPAISGSTLKSYIKHAAGRSGGVKRRRKTGPKVASRDASSQPANNESVVAADAGPSTGAENRDEEPAVVVGGGGGARRGYGGGSHRRSSSDPECSDAVEVGRGTAHPHPTVKTI